MKTRLGNALGRRLGWIVVLFAFGLIGGWCAKSFYAPNSAPDLLSSTNAPPESKGVGSSDLREAGKDSAGQGDFFSRVHAALSIPARAKRARAIQTLADGLDASQIQEALARLEKLRIPNRDDIVAQLFARWGEIDPQAAIEFAQRIPKTPAQSAAVNAVLGAWVENDATSAERWVSELPDGILKNSAWEGLINVLAVADPKRALLLAGDRNLSWQGADTIAQAIFPRWIAMDPQAAAKHAAELAPGTMRNIALRTVGGEWANSNVAEALAWAESLPEQDFSVKVPNMIGASPIHAVLETWMNKDSAAGVHWLSQLPDGDKKESLTLSAFTALRSANPNPQVVMQLAQLLPEGSLRNVALQQFAHVIASWSPATGLEWLRQPMDPAQRGVIFSGLISHLSGIELLSALQLAEGLDAIGRENLISTKSTDGRTRWGLADPATLAKWAESQPNNQGYLNRIAYAWTQRDPDAASRWLEGLPPAGCDTAIRHILDETFFSVPIDTPADTARYFQAAERWILHINSMPAREAAYEKLAERWVPMDSEFARAWLKDSPLSQATKDRLLKEKRRQ